MRKVYVNVTARLIIQADDGQDIEQVLSNMDYGFTASELDDADIVDSELTDWEVTDSK
jgi:hypothetical protein